MKLHFSLDFWETIATYNRDFSAQRLDLLATTMATTHEVAKQHYLATKRFVDGQAEQHGIGLTTRECMSRCLRAIDPDVSDTVIDETIVAVQALALSLSPTISTETIKTAKAIVEAGNSISIASNTNFVTGQTIRRVLDRAGFPYSFALFSDEEGVAKPSPQLFRKVRHLAPVWSRLIHLGDNPICDVEGGRAAGFLTQLVDRQSLPRVMQAFVEKEPVYAG